MYRNDQLDLQNRRDCCFLFRGLDTSSVVRNSEATYLVTSPSASTKTHLAIQTHVTVVNAQLSCTHRCSRFSRSYPAPGLCFCIWCSSVFGRGNGNLGRILLDFTGYQRHSTVSCHRTAPLPLYRQAGTSRNSRPWSLFKYGRQISRVAPRRRLKFSEVPIQGCGQPCQKHRRQKH